METLPNGTPPLAGIRILDLTLAMAGPLSTQRLGELGADVIKIEAPGGGDFSRHWHMGGITSFGDAIPFITLNQNKRSLVLNLKADEGRDVLYRLVETADAVVMNYRPGVAARLGIDYQQLKQRNPQIVVVSITGYGEDGPMVARPGQDLLLQSFTGLTFNGGSEDGLPQASPLYMVDTVASHMASEAVLSGLIGRARRGEGAAYSVNLMNAIMEMQTQEITAALTLGGTMPRSRSPQASIWMEPPYGIYRTQHGFLALAQADLDVLGTAIAEPSLAELKRNRPGNSDPEALNAWRDKIYFLVQERLMTDEAKVWDATLSAIGIWCALVNDYDTFLHHPQAQPALIEVVHPRHGKYRTVAPGIREHGAGPFAVSPAPAYGGDTSQILAELGFSSQDVDALTERGVVVCAA